MGKLFITSLLAMSLSHILHSQVNTKNYSGISLGIVDTRFKEFALQPNISFSITPKMSVLLETSFVIAGRRDSSSMNKKYYKLKGEWRYFLNASKSKYVALQYSFANRSFRDMDKGTFYSANRHDTLAYSFQSASIKSPISTIAFQYGKLYQIKPKLCIDIFGGLGLRYINTEYSNIQNLQTFRLRRRDDLGSILNINDSYETNGKITRLHFNAGVRFLYSLN